MDKFKKDTYVISKISAREPGLTKGNKYLIVNFGFFRGAWVQIINDHGERISINDAEKYLKSAKKSAKKNK
jgi:hypothetical protein